MRRFAIALGSLALATLSSAPALAQTVTLPVPSVSASAGVGIIPGIQVGGQISVGLPQVPVPVPAPAQPQVIYQAPAQPPMMYAPPPQRRVFVRHEPNWGAERLGLDLRLEGAAGFGGGKYGSAYGLGGGGIGLRYRALPHLGFEAGIDLLGGRDYNDMKRLEVAGTAGALVFFNPRSRAQLYLSAGMLLDHARASDDRVFRAEDPTYNHFGGYAGLGLEFFASRHIAFHVDARGLVRQKIGGNTDAPEFTEPGTGRTTNTSAGFVGSGGMTIYF